MTAEVVGGSVREVRDGRQSLFAAGETVAVDAESVEETAAIAADAIALAESVTAGSVARR